MTERVGAIMQIRKINDASKPFTVDKHQAGTVWDWIRKEMGFLDDPEFVLHVLRHTTATRLIDKGISESIEPRLNNLDNPSAAP